MNNLTDCWVELKGDPTPIRGVVLQDHGDETVMVEWDNGQTTNEAPADLIVIQ